MALSKIDNFERRNPDIGVNVLTTQSGIGVYTYRKSKHLDRKHNVNLFLLCDEEKKHYIAINNLSGVLSKLNSKYKGVEHYCIDCLQGFLSKQARDGHFQCCKDNDTAKIEIPKEGSKIKFHGGQYQFKVSFMLYADFESTVKPNEDKGARDLARYKDKMKQLEQKEEEESFTEKINTHIPSGFCSYTKFAYGKVENLLKLYRGKDCIEVFAKHVVDEVKRLYSMFPQREIKILTKEEWSSFNNATKCHICL